MMFLELPSEDVPSELCDTSRVVAVNDDLAEHGGHAPDDTSARSHGGSAATCLRCCHRTTAGARAVSPIGRRPASIYVELPAWDRVPAPAGRGAVGVIP